MKERFVAWLLRALRRERFEIGRVGDVYLTRWTLIGKRGAGSWRIFLHLFHRSDYAGALHDHPWGYTSLILWPGYYEHTAQGRVKFRRWYGPLSLLRRPAAWAHRVELDRGRKCWTLIYAGPRVRSWGFWCPSGWRHWESFDANEQAGLDGCEPPARPSPSVAR